MKSSRAHTLFSALAGAATIATGGRSCSAGGGSAGMGTGRRGSDAATSSTRLAVGSETFASVAVADAALCRVCGAGAGSATVTSPVTVSRRNTRPFLSFVSWYLDSLGVPEAFGVSDGKRMLQATPAHAQRMTATAATRERANDM